MDAGYKEARKRIQQALDENLLELNLSGLKLTAVPPEILQLTELRELVLSSNQLTDIPSEIVQ